MEDFFYLQSMEWDELTFREKLESQHEFPGKYLFKFIVPQGAQDQLLDLLPEGKVSFRESSGNKYISVTLDAKIETSQEVLDVYKRAKQVEGVIAL